MRVVSAKGVRFAHGFVFAPQNFFIGWGRLTACIAGHAIQRKNPQDESQRFSKWRLPTLPRCNAVPSAMLCVWALARLCRAPLRPLCVSPRALCGISDYSHTILLSPRLLKSMVSLNLRCSLSFTSMSIYRAFQ